MKNVTVKFGSTTALSDVTLTCAPGSITAVIGGDGAGKTTLLKVLAGRIVPTEGTVVGAEDPHQIGYQPAESGVWRNLSVAENVEFCARVYGISGKQAQERSDKLLRQAGLLPARHRLAGKLSGGMRQKLGVVLATMHQPAMVILDEPTTGVDPISRAELWSMMSAAAAEGATVIFATTYLDEAERATKVCLLDEGKLLAAGPPAEITAEMPGQLWLSETAQQANSRNWRRGNKTYAWTETAATAPGSDFSPAAYDLENANIVLLLNKPEVSLPAVHNMQRPVPKKQPLAVAEHVAKNFGNFHALDDVSLTVHPGEIVGLIGGNGAGKTTLMRILLGVEQPTAGTVQLFGASPNRKTRDNIGYVAQGLGLYPTLSAAENLAFAAAIHHVSVPAALSDYAKALGSTPIERLSLGTRRHLAFLAATMHQPQLLVADEPTSGMDALSRVRLWRDLRTLANQGAGILVTTHYMQEAEQCDRLVILADGNVVTAGTAQQITAGKHTLTITTSQWANAISVLQANGIVSLLDAHTIRIPTATERAVVKLLTPLAADMELGWAPATLEEAMLRAIS